MGASEECRDAAVAGGGLRRGGDRGGDGGCRGKGGGRVRGAGGGGGEVGFDAGCDVCFAGGFAAVGAFGREGGVADWTFVFFAEDGD